MFKRSGSLALGIIVLISLAAGSAYAQTGKCQGAKMKASGKKAGCLLKVRSKAAAKAVAPDPTKITACETKFSAAFTKAESKPPCATTGDASTIESAIERLFANDVAAEIALSPPSKCQGAKVKAAGKLASCLLGVEAKGAKKSLPPDSAKLMACKDKFSAAFTKAELAGDCGAATGDTAVIQAKLELLEADMVCQLGAGPACGCGSPDPAFLGFTTSVGSGNCGSTVNDSGSPIASLGCNNLYTGGGSAAVPPATVPDYGSTLTKTNCCAKLVPLKVATATDTGSNRNCSDTGCLYGPPLPIPNSLVPAVSVCVINEVAQPAAGYAFCDAGSVNLDIPLTSNVFLTGDLFPKTADNSLCTGPGTPDACCTGAGTGTCTQDHCVGGDNSGAICTDNTPCTGGGFCSVGVQACPICAGDGLCHAGANNGNACTPGTLLVTGPQWPTSQDCPPSGSPIGSLPIPYLLTTGTATKTAVDQPSETRVFCGFCADPDSATFKNPPVACTGDADCAAFTGPDCGGSPCTGCKQRTSGAFGSQAVRTITENGAPAGAIATGDAPASSTLVSVFCIPPTFNGTIDGVGDLPGPGAASLQGQTQLLP